MLLFENGQWTHTDKKGKKSLLSQMATQHIKAMINISSKYGFTIERDGDIVFQEEIYRDELSRRKFSSKAAHELNKEFYAKVRQEE